MPFFGKIGAVAALAGAVFLTPLHADAGPRGRGAPRAGESRAGDGRARVAAKGAKKPSTKPPAARPKAHAAPRRDVAPPRAPLAIDLPFQARRLTGGVLAVVVPSASAPVVTVVVAEGSGSAEDPQGRGGLASLRARAGEARATAEQRAAIVAARGGEVSIRVGPEDVIARYVMPAHELSLPLWLERDRLEGHLSETSLVSSLRAMADAREHDPSARHRSALEALVHSGLPAYAHDPDGTADELVAIRNDAIAGALAPRAPRPVVVVVAGAVDADAAFRALDAELGSVSARPSSSSAPPLPDQTNQREAVVTDPRAGTATIWMGFAIPLAAAKDHAALELAGALLANAPRSRLQRALVDDGLARRTHAELDARRGPSELRIAIELAPGADPVRAREVAERAMLELGKSAPPPEELRRAVTYLVGERSRRLGDPATIAQEVASAALRAPEVFEAQAGSVPAHLDRWDDTTGDAVARAVATHLSPIRRNVLEVRPEHPLEAPSGITMPKPSGRRAATQAPRPAAAAPAANDKKPAANDKKPAANDKKPAANDKKAEPAGHDAPAGKPPAKGAREARPAKKRGKP